MTDTETATPAGQDGSRPPRAVLTLAFTLVQAWSITIALTTLHPNGSTRWALSFVLAASVVTILDSWAAIARRRHQPRDEFR